MRCVRKELHLPVSSGFSGGRTVTFAERLGVRITGGTPVDVSHPGWSTSSAKLLVLKAQALNGWV